MQKQTSEPKRRRRTGTPKKKPQQKRRGRTGAPKGADRLLGTVSAAAVLDCSTDTVKRRRSEGRIPGFFKVEGYWKIWESDLRAYIERERKKSEKAKH